MTCYAYGSVLMCLDLTWYDSLWLVQSWCVWTKPIVTGYDWFCPDVFRPNLMWSIVIGSVLIYLDQIWCGPLCLGSILMCGPNLMRPIVPWFYPNVFGPNWMWPIVLMWLNCCENWRGSKKFKVPKKNPKLQEIFHLKKKIEVQKRNSKFKWENGTKEENQEFQKSKRDFKGKWWNKFF